MEYLKFRTKREKVLFFINDFKKFEDNDVLLKTFSYGYCYYFALILKSRFNGNILYDMEEGHFVIKISQYIYDINGDVTYKYNNKELLKEDQWSKDEEIVYGCIEKYVKF